MQDSSGTKTLKTTSGSVAINAGTSVQGSHPVAIPTTDQRGAPRNGTTDIGAYEYWDDDGSLAVELSSFIATSFDGTVTLRWVTETEVNNVGYSIYRSEQEDGNYTKIAFVDGAGNTAMPRDYQFVDKKAEAGKTYFYSLKTLTSQAKEANPILSRWLSRLLSLSQRNFGCCKTIRILSTLIRGYRSI